MMPAPRTVGPRKLRLLQGSPEWLAARREYITATAMAAIEGVSPWKCEQDLADEMLLGTATESSLVMRVGSALEDLIASAYSEQTGNRVRRVRGLWVSRRYPWAAASPDATAGPRLVELKWSGSRSRFASGLPEDVEVQARWQAMVAEVAVVDVAALVVGEDRVRIFTVERDATIEDYLIGKALDFRRRLAEGGPFAQSLDSLKRKYPADDGTEVVADPDVADAVRALIDVRERIGHPSSKTRKATGLHADAEILEKAIQTRMGPATALIGDGFRVTWKAVKDSADVDWKAVAKELAAPEEVVARHTRIKPGGRRFTPRRLGEDTEE